jgi:hypothetical protein
MPPTLERRFSVPYKGEGVGSRVMGLSIVLVWWVGLGLAVSQGFWFP